MVKRGKNSNFKTDKHFQCLFILKTKPIIRCAILFLKNHSLVSINTVWKLSELLTVLLVLVWLKVLLHGFHVLNIILSYCLLLCIASMMISISLVLMIMETIKCLNRSENTDWGLGIKQGLGIKCGQRTKFIKNFANWLQVRQSKIKSSLNAEHVLLSYKCTLVCVGVLLEILGGGVPPRFSKKKNLSLTNILFSTPIFKPGL